MRRELDAIEREVNETIVANAANGPQLFTENTMPAGEALRKIIVVSDANLGFTTRQLVAGLSAPGYYSTPGRLDADLDFLYGLSTRPANRRPRISERQQKWIDDIKGRFRASERRATPA